MANAVRINKTQRRKINVFVRCVGISLLAWLLFSISNQYTVSVKAAIEYVNLPEKRAFHPQQSDTVKVKLEMTGWQFLFSKAALETPKVQVDLSSLKTKDWIVFSNQLGFINRQFPHEQRVVSVSPDTLFFDFSKQTQRKVPVKPLANIGFKRGYGFIADTKVTPAYVTITGPYEDVSAIEYWETDTVRGKEVETDVRTVANLARNQKANINVYPTSVEVLMPVGELTEKIIELPVKVENGQRYSSVRLSPSKVVVTVLMSVKDYNTYTSRDFEAVVDLSDWEKNEVQYLPILLTKVPDYCKVISVVPQNVDFFVRK
ncbi:CdaR family protein [Sphingobacterium sp. G1-14]|uniref:CdaR family protein n=1 Tax=Sphingobacterium TaxID=28453 RepID=UPI000B48C371|nr:hypothetical protein [Sphingobacterium sp. G1-14]